MENNENGCCGKNNGINGLHQDNSNDSKEDSGCGCGCGYGSVEYPDESLVDNPKDVKVIAEDGFIEKFEKYAHSIDVKSIGYTQVPAELILTNEPLLYTNAIVITMEMDKQIIETEPGAEAQRLNDLAYAKLGNMTYKLSDYLRENGFATQTAHPYESIVNFSPLAEKAGLGLIGKSGLLITPELGPRQKIAAILVNIKNLPIQKYDEHTWIADYCKKCSNCVKACPEKALIEKESCCGEKETEFVQNLCIGCSEGCTFCIEECPFDKKGYIHIKNKFDKLNAKLIEKKNKVAKDL